MTSAYATVSFQRYRVETLFKRFRTKPWRLTKDVQPTVEKWFRRWARRHGALIADISVEFVGRNDYGYYAAPAKKDYETPEWCRDVLRSREPESRWHVRASIVLDVPPADAKTVLAVLASFHGAQYREIIIPVVSEPSPFALEPSI